MSDFHIHIGWRTQGYYQPNVSEWYLSLYVPPKEMRRQFPQIRLTVIGFYILIFRTGQKDNG